MMKVYKSKIYRSSGDQGNNSVKPSCAEMFAWISRVKPPVTSGEQRIDQLINDNLCFLIQEHSAPHTVCERRETERERWRRGRQYLAECCEVVESVRKAR